MEKNKKTPLLKPRTKQFALRVIRLTESLPKTAPAQVIGKQLLRSALSVGANYRSACRARSRADFVSKMGLVEEEADESAYWMEMLVEADIMKKDGLGLLMDEASAIAAMVVASIRTARKTLK
jgi:four helix bundle protein